MYNVKELFIFAMLYSMYNALLFRINYINNMLPEPHNLLNKKLSLFFYQIILFAFLIIENVVFLLVLKNETCLN